MAALDQANIPSNINTYERLAFWAIQCLADISNGMAVNVVQNAGSVPRVQAQLAKIADGSDTAVLTAYLPIDWAVINGGTEKSWMAAEDISTAAPAAVYLAN